MTSIRARLLAGTGLGVALGFAIAGALVLVLARSSLYRQFDDALVARASALAALVEEDGGSVEVEIAPGGVPGDPTYFELWDGEHVLLRSTSLGAGDLARGPGRQSIESVELPDGSPGRQVTSRFAARREPSDRSPRAPSIVTLVLARPIAELSAATTRLGVALLGGGLIGTLVCLVILTGAIRFGLAPVRSLAAAIAELREGAVSVGLDTARTPRELRPVIDRLDELLRRLAGAIVRERELTAEVAHELRTPIAGLRATIEVTLSKTDRLVEKYLQALAECLEITRQTERLVETMLSLARAEASDQPLIREVVHLDDLLREGVAMIAARADERAVSVTCELPLVTATTDRDQLLLVIQNLLDNAVSYVDDRGAISVELSPGTITISNTGCALAPADIERVFERFWRGDAARSAGTHAGLGLALCKKLVRRLGGTISARVEGTSFVVVVGL